MAVLSLFENYRVEEYLGRDLMESVRPLWEKWQSHPNADFEFFSTIVKSRTNVVDPIALVISRKDVPVALAACRLEKVILPISFGYFKFFRIEILQLTAVYGGLMGAWDEDAAMVFVRHLRQQMRAKHIDVVYCAAMRLDHPVYQTAQKIFPFHRRGIPLKDNLHWWADLPDTFAAFQKKNNSKHRTQLRSKERKLTELCGGTLRTRIFHTHEDVSLFCSIAEKIAHTTYLRGLGEGFHNNPEMRNRLDLAARKGWMKGFVLYANEEPCAFWLGTLYNTVFYLDYTGFNSAFKDYAPGQILFIKMVEHLCSAGGISGMDFGFGDANYKQRYGNRNWEESDLSLFAATLPMVAANMLRKSTTLLRRIAEKLLDRFNLVGRIKKKWRMNAENSVRAPRVVRARKCPEPGPPLNTPKGHRP